MEKSTASAVLGVLFEALLIVATIILAFILSILDLAKKSA